MSAEGSNRELTSPPTDPSRPVDLKDVSRHQEKKIVDDFAETVERPAVVNKPFPDDRFQADAFTWGNVSTKQAQRLRRGSRDHITMDQYLAMISQQQQEEE